MISTILFDLDGTLLPMDQDKFIRCYFNLLADYFTPLGYDKKQLFSALNNGTGAMLSNDGKAANRDKFWDNFAFVLGKQAHLLEPEFEKFYSTVFELAKETTQPTPYAADCIRILKKKGYDLIVATNPMFPPVATRARIRWAGLNPDDFIHITTYDNSSYCKPKPAYFQEILLKTGKEAKECLMIGNDAAEDMVSADCGMDTYLLLDCLINEKNLPLEQFKKGNFLQLKEFFFALPDRA